MTVRIPLVIDRIHMVVAVPSPDQYDFLLGQLHGMKDLSQSMLPKGNMKIQNEKYCTRLDYYPEKGRKIAELIVGASKSNKRYFKLVLYPSKFKDSEFEALKGMLSTHFEGFNYAKLFHSSNVSYIELASDVLFHPVNEFLPFRPKTSTSSVYKEADGALGSMYLGSPKSELRFCIYDKAKQLSKSGSCGPFHHRSRIEARIRRTKVSPVNLLSLQNPFLRLEIADLAIATTASSEPEWPAFLTACAYQGVSVALSGYPEGQRKRFLKALRASKASWWDPGIPWKGLAKAIALIQP